MKFYLLLIFFLPLIMGCKSDNPFQNINHELVNEIIVSDQYIYQGNTVKSGIGVDVIEYYSADKLFIQELFSSYLKKATEKPRKILYPYELSFTYNDQIYSLLFGQNFFMFEGVSYETNNIENYIVKKLKIEKRYLKP